MEDERNHSTLGVELNQLNKKPKLTPIIVLPSNTHSLSKLEENCSNNGRLNVQYVSVAYHNESHLINGIKSDANIASHKPDGTLYENDKKCFIALPVDNVSNLSDSESSVKPGHQTITNQRVLISPTDFLSLSEEVSTTKSSAVKRDVNLSTSCMEVMKRNDNNMAISLDRYCESPFMLETQRETQLISDDDASNNGRVSGLSESHEDITTDDLFATTLGDQHSALREVVVTPVDTDSPRNTPVNKEFIRYLNNDSCVVKEEKFETEEDTIKLDCRSNLTVLNPVDSQNESELSPPHIDNSKASINSSTLTPISEESSVNQTPSSSCITMAVPVAPLDIKILPTGLLQLAANIAAVFPNSTMQKQIALQLLREDGTSIIVPITTRANEASIPDASAPTNSAENIPVESATSSHSLTVENSQNQETDRPFKCELCNSTFTRLGNYTRHKKIHSLPSKEDQRFRCDICGKSFIQRCDLARHLHIHRGTEPHRCSQCGKGYIRHSDLVTHQRFHNKEKPFACPHCSKGFCQRGDLNRHLRSIHLQLKPILCSHCHKKFAKEETLLRHINANHRDKLTVN
ncbi:zinc finger protein-like protein [Dinothrombium tinctorium]|uniref:Zinc finger protein-like protein n=1 Tax=Dinothrombium tinctorium TaxID=1965070 RepID=A0A3S3P7E7_9ACAR|nr:zinc finger protein-like protein [Dinothrombium tinctorium]RWS16513.1 zinc finger protein-like protein [Dinothrombium tinctorium]RWS16523.1 zinc finger protein-like protein [Dinothrombium tinctorium]